MKCTHYDFEYFVAEPEPREKTHCLKDALYVFNGNSLCEEHYNFIR